ncbi:AAA family ATPase [Olleya sp. Hel_I_94]|uniref:AAA family ATPase n=1 Tax=Olleya sp. Hel_I_94 TaxID=1250001 RepID=UPI0011A25B4B|nr:AAA family ATPase [Olleya sp. Hel_I_94]TVZ49874.1 putative AbiEii toxin of type IV toxin-antitoxin system [Olleya sp. Hel_I_94]
MFTYTLSKEFKSLKPIEINLPDFIVLTGLNGVGKTQFLQTINGKTASVTENGRNLNNKRFFNTQSLKPNNLSQTDPIQFSQEQEMHIEDMYMQFQDYSRQSKLPNFKYEIFLQERYGNTYNIFSKTLEYLKDKKEIENITRNDFINLPSNINSSSDLFHQNFTIIFQKWLDAFHQNEYNQFLESKGDKVIVLSSEEFTKIHGPKPWKIINSIFRESGLNYKFNVDENYRKYSHFSIQLYNTVSNVVINNFEDLSSGEKVIMSLAFALYNSRYKGNLPDIILLDEPDASLHPLMSKMLLNVIEKVFVKKLKIKVILTTHSPSTIALTNPENIFSINPKTRNITKVSKDFALSILTKDIPSFSIIYENRRQVFVESENDVEYYEKIYNLLKPNLNREISLSFISSGDTRTDTNGIKVSNCAQVINISKTIRNAGNNFVYGIIDWDLNNEDYKDYIIVNGKSERYNIENLIFDPLLVVLLLIRNRIGDFEKINIDYKYSKISTLKEIDFQLIIDSYIKSISDSFICEKKNENLKISYINGMELSVPKWYLHYQGHKLEDILINKFPKLNEIKRKNEKRLKLEIIDKILYEFVEFIPSSFLETFKKIQKV